MKPPRLDLDHVAPRRRPRWPGIALLALSVAVSGDLILRYRDAAAALDALPVAITRPPPVRAVRGKTAEAETKLARAAVRQLALPWASLVRALESTASRDVALLQLQPEAQRQTLIITAEARDTAAMFRYLRSLGAARGLTDVHLISQELVQEDPQHPVRFSAQASFRGMQ